MRIEQDALGVIPIYEGAYYGIHSYRAKLNFEISGNKVDSLLIRQVAQIKGAAAVANEKAGVLSHQKMIVICQAVEEIVAGKWANEFLVDAFQGGAGTSTNMNVNEVIANRGLELMGHMKGEYMYLHPLDDVNRSQSTNDVYPSAGKMAVLHYLSQLDKTIALLIRELEQKANEFASFRKMGRTQLQEAVPTTVGASFAAYASNLKRCRERIKKTSQELKELNLGGTAIGNGLNTSAIYREIIYQELNERCQENFRPAPDLIDATQNTDSFVAISGALKTLAVSLSKIAHDLRLLSSGPRSGFSELNLAPRQAGSSIMPGKVNPVIPEVISQIAFQVIGNDATITFAAESGELELNAFEPVILTNLFESLHLLERGCDTLANKCITEITVNQEKCENDVRQSTGLVTELAPIIGYEIASKVVKEALAANVSIEEILRQKDLFSLFEEQKEQVN